jgi:hypothetical protein
MVRHTDGGWSKLGERGTTLGGRPRAERPPESPTEPPELVVYFLKNGKRKSVKIGVSGNVEKRLSSINTAAADKLTCIATVEGGYGKEKALHKQFKAYWIKGEWFRLEGELAEYVASLPTYKPKRK